MMRILLDSGSHDQRNKGNVALLQAAAHRFRGFWPEALIEALTDAPHLLRFYCPDVYPVSPHGQEDSPERRASFDKLHRMVPRLIFRLLFELRDETQFHGSKFRPDQLRRKRSPGHAIGEETEPSKYNIQADHEDNIEYASDHPLANIISKLDLFVASGGGYMCDSDKESALNVLDRLEIASKFNVPTAMVGQGIGPIQDRELIERASAVLPKVDLILVRERQIAPKLLTSIGVDPSRIIMTGDDAIKMAYDARTKKVGNGIGVNLRLAHYTEVGVQHIDIIRPILHRMASKHSARLIGLPISNSLYTEKEDAAAINQLLNGFHNVQNSRWRFDSPTNIIKRVRDCRLVVTGAFHPAVFALSQGIPVIGLVKSKEYVDKFSGLADLFGSGCQVMILNDEEIRNKLATAIDYAWESFENLRPTLLEAAEHQSELAYIGYQRIFELIMSKKPLVGTKYTG